MARNLTNSKSDKIDKLRFALNNQIEWQKYAEGKNLLFITICAGTLVFIYTDISASKADSVNIIKNCSWFYIAFIVTTLVSFFIGIFSLRILHYQTKFANRVSLISWDYARSKTREELRGDLKKYSDDEHIDDLLDQHIYGSKITNRKYRLFGIGIAIYQIGVVSLIIEFLQRLYDVRF